MKRIAPNAELILSRVVVSVDGGGPVTGRTIQAAHKELAALRRCARVLRRLRAAGGGWDVDARYEADQALAALSGKAGRKW